MNETVAFPPMKYGDVFEETLESLGIHGIYTDGFDAEQIFFQLDNATRRRIESLERSISQSHAKLLDARGAAVVEEASAQVDESSCAPDDVSEQVSDGDSTVSEESASHSLGSELDRSSEETVSFEDDMWGRSRSSDVELINEPAHKVLEVLKGRGNPEEKN